MLDDLTAAEIAILGHAIRMVPSEAVLIRTSAVPFGGGIVFLRQTDAFASLWSKVAETVRERPDLEPFRLEHSEAI
jgi:hypothetical protein